MTCIILGPVKINDVEGTIVTGNTLCVAPNDVSRVSAGAGGFNTGDFHNHVSGISITITANPRAAAGTPAAQVPPTGAPPTVAPPEAPPNVIPIGVPPVVP